MGSESFSANARISQAFLALRPAGSRIVAKTVCPLRARVSANSLPNPVLEPVMRTTCLEFMIILPWWRYRENYLMPEAKRLVTKMNSTDGLLGNETTHSKENHNLSKLLDGTPEYSSTKIDHLRGRSTRRWTRSQALSLTQQFRLIHE